MSHVVLAADSQVLTDDASRLGIARAAQHAAALVIGSEGQGLSADSRSRCSPVSIPMPGEMESLNASHAGAILMFMLSNQWPLLSQRLDAAVERQMLADSS